LTGVEHADGVRWAILLRPPLDGRVRPKAAA
jgi:hypothetical protein